MLVPQVRTVLRPLLLLVLVRLACCTAAAIEGGVHGGVDGGAGVGDVAVLAGVDDRGHALLFHRTVVGRRTMQHNRQLPAVLPYLRWPPTVRPRTLPGALSRRLPARLSGRAPRSHSAARLGARPTVTHYGLLLSQARHACLIHVLRLSLYWLLLLLLRLIVVRSGL